MFDITDYAAIIEEVESPNLLKLGYRVELSVYENGINVSVSQGGAYVGDKNVSFTTSNAYGSRVNKEFSTLVNDIIYAAVEIYDKHNKTFGNAELLKALEDKINGPAVEMLVLGEPAPRVEDSRATHLTTVARGIGYWFWDCADCDESSRDFPTQGQASIDAMRHTLHSRPMMTLHSLH